VISADLLARLRFVEAVRFPAEEVSPDARVNVREVRAYLREVLTGAGVDLGDMDLMAAEIVTNAVRHTASGRPGGQVRVAVIATDERVRVEITDQGGTETEPCIPPYPVLGGRGLLIVQELAARWDWSRGRDGRTTVWFEMPRGRDGRVATVIGMRWMQVAPRTSGMSEANCGGTARTARRPPAFVGSVRPHRQAGPSRYAWPAGRRRYPGEGAWSPHRRRLHGAVTAFMTAARTRLGPAPQWGPQKKENVEQTGTVASG
jgi:anti-sigma regulatory factor (Ser/Thr protein kinase)